MNRKKKNASVSPQVKDLEQSLQATEEQLSQSKDVVAGQEAQIQKLVSVHHVQASVLSSSTFAEALDAHNSVQHEQNEGWEGDPEGSVLPRAVDCLVVSTQHLLLWVLKSSKLSFQSEVWKTDSNHGMSWVL